MYSTCTIIFLALSNIHVLCMYKQHISDILITQQEVLNVMSLPTSLPMGGIPTYLHPVPGHTYTHTHTHTHTRQLQGVKSHNA